MNDKLSLIKGTVISTGKGKDRTIVVTGKPQVSSRGKVVGYESKVDVVFVFDTTGSMDNKIEGLKRTCKFFVDEAKSLDLDMQFALISFGDIKVEGGGDTIEVVVSPTDNIDEIKYGLTYIPRNHGFGNDGESSMEAIREALELKYRAEAVKVLILITDEPAHQHNITADEMTKRLSEREFLAFTITPPFPYYQEMALKNGGIWKEVGLETDLSEILEAFKEIARKVSEVAEEVHLLADGSVKRYLQLKPPKPD